MRSLTKILITGTVLIALLVLGRGLYFAPNGDIGAGLPTGSTSTTPHLPKAGGPLPERLLIPKLDIDTEVQHVGVTKAGNMAAPNNFVDVSWYKLGTIPGEAGSAVIAGHEDNALSLDGVFKHLEDLEIGDRIFVVEESGKQREFRVVEKKIHPYDLAGPELERIFNAQDKARLNLITCAGDWLPAVKTNDKRLVIYTELVD